TSVSGIATTSVPPGIALARTRYPACPPTDAVYVSDPCGSGPYDPGRWGGSTAGSPPLGAYPSGAARRTSPDASTNYAYDPLGIDGSAIMPPPGPSPIWVSVNWAWGWAATSCSSTRWSRNRERKWYVASSVATRPIATSATATIVNRARRDTATPSGDGARTRRHAPCGSGAVWSHRSSC